MMYRPRTSHVRTLLLAGCAAIALSPALARAEAAKPVLFSIPAQDLGASLNQFARQSEHQIVFSTDIATGKTAGAVQGELPPEQALAMLLAGTDLTWRRDGDAFMIVRASDPQSGSAAGDGADGTVQALIVTAQKREEDIQDVPIAISAFTQEDLTKSQVAGGPDLVTQIPNFTFTKTNFTGYSIQIRGIGTQAISATTDPAVAVAFNNTPFIRNHFFEQEFYDLQRVEVLRGPQGTLYGRNATAGVVNIISAKPKFSYEAKLSADIGNYGSSRLEGMLNIPLVEDMVALRLAGAWTKRDGYAFNQLTEGSIDGRDLWSTRVSLRVTPNDRLDANLIWEHFQEDDDRLRSGKQLCTKDVVNHVGDIPVEGDPSFIGGGQGVDWNRVQGVLSQGCKRGSLYSPDAFQTPNGKMLPYYGPLSTLNLQAAFADPYVSATQSQDLRTIESTVDPQYRANSDTVELQASFDLTDSLTLTSETGYAVDELFSLQDFNRFNTIPGAWSTNLTPTIPSFVRRLGAVDENGVFCDPQLGCSDRLVLVDLSTAKSRQFSQEFRLSSDYDGPFNFSLGANFLRYDTEDKYYVFINSLSLYSFAFNGRDESLSHYMPGVSDNTDCMLHGRLPADPNLAYGVTRCIYIDPNPIGGLNDQGHNYFLSKNPYKLISYAAFGEAYYNVADNLKLTAGLRWTVDKKEAPRIPSWLLVSNSFGYPVAEVIEQEWREPTGRLAIDWKPHLAFTDETLLYASYAHGYKAGGANPPGFVRAYYADFSLAKALIQDSATRPKTFDPEFVNAFEVGTKNTLLDGRMTLNLTGFYYDYTGYQVSEIVERSAFNRNFDATVWGAEIESDWRPIENLKLGFKGGYEKTRIADGEQAIDLMDRTAGDPNWILVRPFPTQASSCIVPAALFTQHGTLSGVELTGLNPTNQLYQPGAQGGGNPGTCELAYVLDHDPVSTLPYTPYPTARGPTGFETLSYWPAGSYPGWNPETAPNNGEGIFKQLGGNELPNAPHWTATVTGDYTLPLPHDWLMTLHSDVHWQSQSWWRVFNDDVYDKLHPYFTMNLAAIFSNDDAGWNIMAYVKNVTDETAITGAFLNSDDTGLTTNVFLTEPRLYGLRVTKAWTGNSPFGDFGARHEGPYPFTVEIGGQVQRHDAPNEALSPDFIDQFSADLNPLSDQGENLDWGDGREVRLIYRPSSDWTVSLAGRFGRTNGSSPFTTRREEADRFCWSSANTTTICETTPQDTGGINDWAYLENYTVSDLKEHEEHTLVDFMVGKDVGMGGLDESTLSTGIRYAELKSATSVQIFGRANGNIVPDAANALKYFNPAATFDQYEMALTADRQFKGAGPVLAWEASKALLGNRETGVLQADWTLTGGVLFGQRKTTVDQGEATAWHWAVPPSNLFFNLPLPPTPTVTPSTTVTRSESVTVPTFGASLGLSYKVDRFKVGAGYRWERYQDAIDGGFTGKKAENRTIDGPYFKVSVGFGG